LDDFANCSIMLHGWPKLLMLQTTALKNHVELIYNVEHPTEVRRATCPAKLNQNLFNNSHDIQFLQTLTLPWEYYRGVLRKKDS